MGIKAFDLLTDDELCALTDEQIEYYKDLACAERGVALLPPRPGAAPEEPQAEKDLTIYTVGGLMFEKREDAEKIAELANSLERMKLDYVHGPSYQKIAVKKNDQETIDSESYYSAARWQEVRSAVEAYERKKREWNEDVKAFDEANRKRRNETSYIEERIELARERKVKRERMAKVFDRYVELADGDEEAAWKFMTEAYPDASEYLESPVVEERSAVEQTA